jgi:hypothetical protein
MVAYPRARLRVTLFVAAAGTCAMALTPAMAASGGSALAAGTISTVAGGVGGPGPAATVAEFACGVRVAGTSLYVGNFNTVRRVSTSTGALTTLAGNKGGIGGGNGDPAAKVPIGNACGTAVDAAGNLLVADGEQVQVVAAKTGTFYGQPMTAGHIYAIAGQPNSDRSAAPAGDGGPALKANLFDATGVALDHAGNLVIADSGMIQNCGDCTPVGALIRVVAESSGTFYGQQMTAGDIYSVAGTASGPGPAGYKGPALSSWLGPTIGAVRLDSAGNLLIPDNGENDVSNVFIAPSLRLVAVKSGTSYGQAMTAGDIYRLAGTSQTGSGGDGGPAINAPLESAGGVAVDATGNLVIADFNRARVIAVRTGTFYGQAMTAGDIYGIAGLSKSGYSGDGGRAISARVSVSAAALDSSGNVVLGGGNRVRVIAAKSGTFYGQQMTGGDIYTAAGNGKVYSGAGGPAARAEFFSVGGAAGTPAGDLAFTDVTDNVVWVVMASSGSFFGRNMTAGDSYPVAGAGGKGAATFDLTNGASVAFDLAGNVLVADWGDNRVRVVAVRTGTFYGQAMTAGHVYSVAGTGAAGFSGDGGPATQAMLSNPSGVATDQPGNLLVADGANRRVRVVAVRTGMFYGQAMTAGDIYTVAGDGNAAFSGDGGPATKAGGSPFDAVPDGSGNLVIADGANQRVRVAAVRTGTFYGQQMTAGDMYTIAGNGTYGFSGNGGPATAAEMEEPDAVAVDRFGNVAITDEFNNAVWVVAVKTGTFYGQAMTAGDIYVVAGRGTRLGNDGLGDGEPATKAGMSDPNGVAVSPAGNLLVADLQDGRMRSISG